MVVVSHARQTLASLTFLSLSMPQTAEQLKQHYQIERELADRLRESQPQARGRLYNEVYSELYERIPEHPMLDHAARAPVQARINERLLAMLSPYLRRDGTYLEIGAGDCALSNAVAPRVAQVIAVEVSPTLPPGLVLPTNVELKIIEQPTEIPAKPGSVSLVFSHQVAEHLMPDDFVGQARNVLAALAPGGHYIVITPNRITGPHDVSRGFDEAATGLHLREYTYSELAAILTGVGFSRVDALFGAKGRYISLPISFLSSIESLFLRRPRSSFARRMSNNSLVGLLLDIRVRARR